MLPASDIDLTLTLDPYREKGMFLGSGGIVFFDESACVIDICKYFLGFCEDESCGRCTTCHGGTQRAVEILRRIQAGGGREADLDHLDQLVKTLVWSNCLHGQFALTSIKTSMKSFREEYLEHIVEKRCRASVCQGLIEYSVRSQSDAALPEAVEICPTGAIVGGPGSYRVDDALCIRCGACKEVAPGAMELRHRFALEVSQGAAAGG
jgi:ferredoxin